MGIGRLASSADASADTVFKGSQPYIVANDAGDLTKLRLREALAREEALLHQLRELTQQHQEVLSKLFSGREDAAHRVASLTLRQRQIMDLVLAGCPNKNIAADLCINPRTVENHRASIMKKTGAKSLPALARLALIAALNGDPELIP